MKPIIIENAVSEEYLRFLEDMPKEWTKSRINNAKLSTKRRSWLKSLTGNRKVQDTLRPLFDEYQDIETNAFIESHLILYNDYELGTHELHQDVFYSEQHEDDIGSIVRKLSMSLLVSDNFTGGELHIMGEDIPLKKGDAVVFPSFLPHVVYPVESGKRLALVSWKYGPHWK